jgi:large subunit ribosomal protein L29
MADKKKAPIQEKSVMGAKELATELRAALEKRARMEFSHKVAALKNPLELRHVRREIARLKTHLRATEGSGLPPKDKGSKAVTEKKEAAK